MVYVKYGAPFWKSLEKKKVFLTFFFHIIVYFFVGVLAGEAFAAEVVLTGFMGAPQQIKSQGAQLQGL